MHRRWLTRSLRILLPLTGALLSSIVGAAAYVVHTMNAPRPRTWRDDYTFSPYEVGVRWERVAFPSEDGVTLRGWWFGHDTESRVVVGLTGHKGVKQDLLGIGSALWRSGTNVLLFDFRGCGESDDAPLSLAHNELQDARSALRYARERLPAASIGIIGYSMGAAIAILTAADDPAVRAVVADSSFASITDVVSDAIRRHRLPASLLVPVADRLNRRLHGYRFGAVRPLQAVRTIAPRPIFIIHGSEDTVTPVAHARMLYEAAGEPKELWIEDGAPHVGAYFSDREGYVRRVTGFFDRWL